MRSLQKRLKENLIISDIKDCKFFGCKKAAVIIDKKEYYCGDHYCLIKGIPSKNGKIQLF